MLPYAAYLRVYEPLSAFPEPDRSAWARYADSPDRPRRIAALAAEHDAAIHRLVARPQVVAPADESTDAYVRRTTDMTFVCPWQTRLRSWTAFSSFRATLPRVVADSFAPRSEAERVEADFERWKRRGDTLRSYILSNTWHVPFAWFIPFSADERCLALGPSAGPERDARSGGRSHGRSTTGSTEESGIGSASGSCAGSTAWPGTAGPQATAIPARTLLYVTSMIQARRRVGAAVGALRGAAGEPGTGLGVGDAEALGRWLEGFHPGALVELDYGGLVHLIDDEALRADESVAEAAAMLDGMMRDPVVARAMYERLRSRWRSVQALANAN
ncbi:MAG TPA: hypothetical protein VFU43_06815 [Streptosporangiaceae bacterium]|nr:hypothetical protein [Streptosporangiaceae bacterium]